jgi:demethylphylloquinol methyltransferase
MDASNPAAFSSKNYDRVASVYEKLAHIYSGGLIRRSKMAQFRYLPAGVRILYLGAGTGEDVIAAARFGFEPTAVDISEKMAARLRDRLARKGVAADVRVADVLAMTPATDGEWDAVCANYFFNVFPEREVEALFAHAARLVKPGGWLMIADMTPQKGIAGRLASFYQKAGIAFFVALGLASFHPIFDYAAIAARLGLKVEAILDHRWANGLPALYRTIVLRKAA